MLERAKCETECDHVPCHLDFVLSVTCIHIQRDIIVFFHLRNCNKTNMTTQSTPVMRKILMLTNIEHGQSNVFLATAQAILEADPSVEIHFATFRGFEGSIAEVSEYARRSTPNARPIVYHEIQGISARQGLQNYIERHNIPAKPGYFPDSVSTPLSFSATKQAIKDFLPAFIPYTGKELGDIVTSIIGIIKDVNADLVVLDPLMTAGLTAVWHLHAKYMILSPNTIKDFAASEQPRGVRFWKYPAYVLNLLLHHSETDEPVDFSLDILTPCRGTSSLSISISCSTWHISGSHPVKGKRLPLT